jgi:peptide/nickel transport system ATP-binding protein/oligopeptide transport system ATP-binding protein
MPPPLLEFDRLSVAFDGVPAVRAMSLSLGRGETAAVVGESGSGKTQAMLAALRLLSPDAAVSGGVRFEGRDLMALQPHALNQLRGRRIAMVFQEPASALDPLFSVGAQIGAVLRLKLAMSRRAARAETIGLLERVGLPEPHLRWRAYPHELSGGQRQRVAIALAIACKPDVLIADEPTTALDTIIAAKILDLLMALKAELGMAMLFISHDLDLVRRVADTVHVMKDGTVVESGPAAVVTTSPQHPYTRSLLAVAPLARPPVARSTHVLIEARDVSVRFPVRGPLFARRREIVAVDRVGLTLRAGATVAVVGESGSGKSTLGRALLNLVPASGLVSFEHRDLRQLPPGAMRGVRRLMQPVFQDPYGSLSPRLSAGEIVAEGLRVHAPHLSRAERDARAAAAFEEVRLDPDARHRRPEAFSGGQRQRIAIARAMILRPKLVVLDEPTSALDRAVQADILALLAALQAVHGLAYVFITHDLAVARAMADEIAVMQRGRIIESGPAVEVLGAPREPYTRELLHAAAPRPPA